MIARDGGVKSLFRESGILNAAELFSRLMTIAVTILVGHIMGTSNLVTLTLGQLCVNLVLVVGDSGFGVVGVRRIAAGENPRVVVKDVLPIQFFITTAALAVVLLVGGRIAPLPLILVLGVGALAYAFNVSYVLLGRLHYERFALARLAGNVSGGVLGCVAVLLSENLLLVGLGLSAGFVVTSGLTWILVGQWGPRRPRPAVSSERRPAWRDIPSGMAYTVSVFGANAGVLLLVKLGGSGPVVEAVAIAWRVLQILLIPVVVAESQLLPRFASGALDKTKVIPIAALGVVACTCASLVVTTAPRLFTETLFGAEGDQFVQATRILVWSLPPFCVVSVCAAFLLSRGRLVATACGYAVVPVVLVLLSAVLNTSIVVSVLLQTLAVSAAACFLAAAVVATDPVNAPGRA